jgi:hypothetical protein
MIPCISVIAPTRKRVPLLHRMLQSLAGTAGDMKSVEVVLRCDSDDDDTIDYLRCQAPSSFIVGPRLDGYATLATLINETARLSQSDLIIVVNDDAVFETHGWDAMLIEEAAHYRDGVFDFGVDTVMNNENFVFPCISRRSVQALGCFFDERLVYTDIWLRDVMSKFGRAIRVPHVRIRHDWTGMTSDQERALSIVQAPTYSALYDQCVAEGREKISRIHMRTA